MPTPKLEYNADSDALQSQRDSIAVKEDYANGFSDLAAFEKNTKSVLLSSTTEPFISSDSSIPLSKGVDEFNQRILCVEGPFLKSTVNAIDYTTIVNFSSNASTSAFWASLTTPLVSRVVMISATSAMVSIGDWSSAFSGTPLGKLYRTDDNFQTFTEKLSVDNGMILHPTKRAGFDWWLAPVYQVNSGGALDAQTVWGSFDDGENWVILAQTTYASILGHAHTHQAQFYDDDTVFIAYGDGIQAKFDKITRPDSWDEASVWDNEFSKIQSSSQFSDIEIDGDIIQLRREGISSNGSGNYIYNIVDDTFDGETFLTRKITATDGKSYISEGSAVGNVLLRNNNLFVTHAHSFGVDTAHGGLYISTNKRDWTVVYRNKKGVRRIMGFLNNQIVVKIFDAAGVERLGLFDIPSVLNKDAVIVEKAVVNNIGLFGGTPDNWVTTQVFDSEQTVYSGADLLYSSETGILVKAKDNGDTDPGRWRLKSWITSDDLGTFPDRIQRPVLDDYCMLSYDVKYTGYADNKAIIDPSILLIVTQTFINGLGGDAQVRTFPISNEWFRVFLTWKTSVTAISKTACQITSELVEGTFQFDADIEVKIQNVQLYYDTDRVDMRTYTPKSATKDDDFSIAQLTGLGARWSVIFDWMPLNGNLSYPSGVVDILPIATIKGGGGEYIELYWDRTAYDGVGGGRAFKLTDGTNTVSLDTELSEAMEWLHNDLLKFGITSDGVDTILYCFNPENKAIQGSLILSKSGLAVLDEPTQIILGANQDEAVIGAGAFANIRGFDSVLSAGDIADVFDSVSNLLGINNDMFNNNLNDAFAGTLNDAFNAASEINDQYGEDRNDQFNE